MSRLSKWFGGRTRTGNAPVRRARALRVEPLEDRRMMAINLYVDFGDGFANDAWNVSDSAMRSVSGPDGVDHDENPATPDVGLFGAGYSVISLEQGVRNRNVDLTGDRRVDRADADLLISQVLATMQRTFEPLGVDIIVRAATNIQDVKNALQSKSSNDAYIFICGDVPAIAEAVAVGIAPLDLGNTRDNTGFAFAGSIMNDQSVGKWVNAIASVACHEAAHSFGLDHSDGTQLIVTGDVMDGADPTKGDYDGVNLFSRYPMPVSGGGTINSFEVLARAGLVGVRGPTAPGYVTGTGAHDRITITRRNATNANVLIEPFTNANLTGALPSYSYIVNMTNGIVVEAGFNNDRIVIDGNLGKVVAVRGGAGMDTIQVIAAAASVSVARTQIKTGSTTINYIETEAIAIQGTGATILSVRGSDAVGPQSIVLDAAMVTGILPSSVTFSGLSSLTLETGAYGNSILVNNTPANATTVLFSGAGQDAVQVLATSASLMIFGQNGADDVKIGRAGSAPSIAETLTISNYSSYTKVTIDDSAASASRSIVMGGDSSYGEVRGLGPSGSRIRYVTADTQSLNFVGGSRGYQFIVNNTPLHANITTGAGRDQFYIYGTTAPLTINAGAGANQFLVGSFWLSGIIGAVDLRGPGGVNSYEFSDIGEKIGQKFYMNANSLYRTDANGANRTGTVTFRDASNLNIYGGSGGNVFYVQDTPVLNSFLAFTNLHTGEGGDFVAVNRTTGALYVDLQKGELDEIDIGASVGGLDTIKGGVILTGAGGRQSVRINDAGQNAARTLTVTEDSVERSGEALVVFLDWRPESLTVSAGRGDDVIDVRGNPATSYTLLEGGAGTNNYRVGTDANTLSNLGNVSILGGDGVDTVSLHDEGEASGQTYTLGNNFFPSLAANGTLVVFHSTVDHVFVHGGQGDDAFKIEHPGDGSLFDLDGNAGRDTLDYSSYDTDVSFDLATGTGTDVYRAIDFENVIGGAGADQLIGDNGDNVLVGGRGANFLDGRAGRDLLIAGADASTLLGGVGDDILIGGATAYDALPAALDSIMAEWGEDASYAARVDHLRNGGGRNAGFLLNPATFETNGGQNTLAGAADQDLFFGSQIRDMHDWDRALAEVFVDPEVFEHVLDASALPGSYLALDYVAYDGDAPINVQLLPGSHFFNTYGGAVIYFTVADDGTIDYDASLDGVLTGRGTNTLTVQGAAVQIDASALPGSYLALDYVAYDGDAPINVQLLPGSHFFNTYGGAVIYFTVADDGTIDYDASLDGVLTGRGTNTLTVQGAAVQIDASALPGSYLALDYVAYDGDAPINVQLLPGSHFFNTYGGAVIYFTVADDGTIDYDASLDGVLTGRGTNTLTVQGAAVQIDASALPGSYLALDYVAYDGDAPINVQLLPGSHFFNSYGGAVVYFTVADDGTIDYDASLDGVLTGRGTNTLTVQGAAVQIDASALPGSYLALDYVAYDGDAPINVQLLPGSHFFNTYGGAVIYFTVADDGTIDYDASLDGVLTGRGTNTLTVQGAAVQIDASALPGSYLALDYVAYDGDAPINVQLLPGSHFFNTYGGAVIYFTVADDGTIDYDASLDGVLTGRGTNTLTVQGAAVQIDASALPGSYLALDYVAYDGDAPINVQLLPGSHFFSTYGGAVVYFTVADDGTIDYDVSLDGILSGRGTSSLVFLQRI